MVRLPEAGYLSRTPARAAGLHRPPSILSTSCVLGDPGSFGAADAAATRLAAISFGGDSVKAYAPIAPFVVPALVGYRLHLSTLDDAAAIRLRVQGI